MRKQLMMAQEEKKPKLLLEKFEFSGNKINLRVHNVGRGEAHSIIIATDFDPASLKIHHWTLQEGHPIAWGLHELAWTSIKASVEGKEYTIYPGKAANHLSKGKTASIILGHNEIAEVSIEPTFWLRTKNNQLGLAGLHKTFPELVEMLKQNGVEAVRVHFVLEYKNAIEDRVGYEPICSFIFQSGTHSTLQDACKANYQPSNTLTPLLRKDIETTIGVEDYRSYKGKSSEHYFPEEKDLDELKWDFD